MPGKKRLLTPEQIERARQLVEAGYRIGDVARRFGVKTDRLVAYGIRTPKAGEGAKAKGA
jgi:transposase-like protein